MVDSNIGNEHNSADGEQNRGINVSDAMSVGLNMTVGFCFFTFIGYQADKKWATEYWTLAGVFLGLLYCGYETWKLVGDINKD